MPDSNFTTKPLVTGQRPLTTDNFSYYSAPASQRTLIKEVVVTNTSPFVNYFSVNLVNDGFSPADQNAIFYNVEIKNNETVLFALNTAIEQNDQIFASCSNPVTGGYINLKITGIEIEDA